MATKYNFIQEVENIWSTVINGKNVSRNGGFVALCCQSYLRRSRAKIHLQHKKVMTINRFLRKYLINSKEKLIQYHLRHAPDILPTIQLKVCRAKSTPCLKELIDSIKSLEAQIQRIQTKNLAIQTMVGYLHSRPQKKSKSLLANVKAPSYHSALTLTMNN